MIIGEDAALVVDTGQFPSLAEPMVAEDIHKRVTLDEFKERFRSFAGTELWRNDSFATFMGPAINRAYQEATGKLKPETED